MTRSATNGSPTLGNAKIGRMERGGVDWPRAPRRTALRTVLEVETDAALGFTNKRQRASDPVPQHDLTAGGGQAVGLGGLSR
jgi:hypothetical protein